MQMNDRRSLMPPESEIGWVVLAVPDLERSRTFYSEVIGFEVLTREEGVATLGVDSIPRLILVERPGAAPRPPGTTGLYHFAILLPGREELARALQRLVVKSYPLGGAADHLVSEALYLSDPDGNGIEIYRDRPREQWRWRDGHVQMATEPLDLRALLSEAPAGDVPWQGLPAGSRIGHIHLQVADLPSGQRFYRDVLGFDLVAHLPGALFLSAGGYHHHVGLNTWQSRGGAPSPADRAGLRAFSILLPDAASLAQLADRLQTAGLAFSEAGTHLTVRDPWGHPIVITHSTGVADAVTASPGD